MKDYRMLRRRDWNRERVSIRKDGHGDPVSIEITREEPMRYEMMKAKAEQLVDALQPFADRIEIAGSIRRQKPEPGDIEIVMIPSAQRLFELRTFLRAGGWNAKKGQVGGRYIMFSSTPFSDQLDLFFATRDNWGLQFAIRTGSADFSHFVLAAGWTALGFHSRNGILLRDGKAYPMREEVDLFRLIDHKWVPPPARTYPEPR